MIQINYIFCDSFEKKMYTVMDNSSTNINKRTIISHLKSFNCKSSRHMTLAIQVLAQKCVFYIDADV